MSVPMNKMTKILACVVENTKGPAEAFEVIATLTAFVLDKHGKNQTPEGKTEGMWLLISLTLTYLRDEVAFDDIVRYDKQMRPFLDAVMGAAK